MVLREKSILQCPLTRAGEFAIASVNEAARTITVVWSTGARVRRTPGSAPPPWRRHSMR